MRRQFGLRRRAPTAHIPDRCFLLADGALVFSRNPRLAGNLEALRGVPLAGCELFHRSSEPNNVSEGGAPSSGC
jgi:hypothetical protein